MVIQQNNFTLSESEFIDFHKNGFAGPFTLYNPAEIKDVWSRVRLELLDRSAAVYSDDSALSGATNIANYDRHLDHGFLAKHVMRQEIVQRVASILGPDVLCWRTEFFPKYPGDDGTDWHQADTFANASGTPQIQWPGGSDFGGTVTVWCAFTDANVDTGCLQFIPGTHRTMFYDETKGMHYNPAGNTAVEKNSVRRGFFGYDYRDLQVDPSWSPDESKAVSIEMRAGQFIMFWSTLMHASHPHLGKTRRMRMGFAARYVPTCVQVYPGTTEIEEYGGKVSLERYGAVLVSGTDAYGCNLIADRTTRNQSFRTQPGSGV
jgi:non-heme Fe2+,alpha-ketoglutarate-dependent halogenase